MTLGLDAEDPRVVYDQGAAFSDRPERPWINATTEESKAGWMDGWKGVRSFVGGTDLSRF